MSTPRYHNLPLLIWAILLLLAGLVHIPLFYPAAQASGQALQLRVGLFENKPMCYTTADGKAAGIFITVLEHVAQQEGWQLVYRRGSFAELRQQLREGGIDILPSTAVSQQRREHYAFNELTTFTNWGTIYVNQQSPIATLLDLQGKRIATLNKGIYTNGPEGIHSLSQRFQLGAEIVEVATYEDGLKAVSQGQADAAVVNRLIGQLQAPSYGLKQSGIVFSPVDIRFALTKDSNKTPALIKAIDQQLALLKKDHNSIYHQAIAQAFATPAPAFQLPKKILYLFWAIVGLALLSLLAALLFRRQVARQTEELNSVNQQLKEEMAQLQEAKKQVLENQQRFESLVHNSSDWIWEFDENDIFNYVSPRIKELLGYEPEEILGTSAFSIMPPEEQAKVAATFAPVKEARQPFSNLININQHKDGHLVTIESSGVPVFDNNNEFRGYRGIDRDISKRQQLEDQLRQAQKMEAIGTLAGGIAHDFNNILSAIIGYTELARDSCPATASEELRSDLEQIFKASLRAKELVQHILTFSRHSEERCSTVKISSIIKEACKLLRATLPASIAIDLSVAPDCSTVWANPTQLHQVLINLATNAAHAMESHGGTLTIGLNEQAITSPLALVSGEQLPVGDYVCLRVSDTGSGISKEIEKKIFDPYFTTKEVGKGSGRGLSVVQGIVLKCGGGITVDSDPGVGTEFMVYFPRFTEPTAAPGPEEQQIAGGHEHILLLDDEADVNEVNSRQLCALGYQVTCASDPLTALELLSQQPLPFQLLVSDQSMPGLSGLELISRLRQQDIHLPVLLCSGYAETISRASLSELAISELLEKPVPRHVLATAIRNALAK